MKLGSPLDLTGNQLENALAEVLATLPGSATEGRFAYDSATKRLVWRDDTAWRRPLRDDVRLDQIAVPQAPVAFNGQRATGAADPTQATDLTTKQYVDANVQGIQQSSAVRAATLGNVNIAAAPATLDGVNLAAGDRILLKDQAAPAENGIRVFQTAGAALARAGDADTWNELVSHFVFVSEGTVNADRGWLSTADRGGTLDTTAIGFSQFSGAGQVVGGNGLTLTGTTLDVNVDGASLEIAADVVRIRALGVLATHLADGAVDLAGTKVGGILGLARGGLAVDASTAAGKQAARTNLGAVGKFASDLTGDGTATSFTVAHGLATTDVQVQVWEASTNAWVLVDVIRVDANTIRVTFGQPVPAAKVYRAVVVG